MTSVVRGEKTPFVLILFNYWLFQKVRGAKTFFYLTAMSKSAYLFSTSCEKQISCLNSVRVLYKQGGRLLGLSRRRFILQATSLQRTVNIENKAGYNSTHGKVSSLFFPAKKYCCTQSTYSTSFMWTEAKDSRPLLQKKPFFEQTLTVFMQFCQYLCYHAS